MTETDATPTPEDRDFQVEHQTAATAIAYPGDTQGERPPTLREQLAYGPDGTKNTAPDNYQPIPDVPDDAE